MVRLQPIVVTLSTMFIVQGITLLVMDKPGGMIAPEFSAVLAGDAIPNLLPAPVVVLAVGRRSVAPAQEHPLRRRRSMPSAATRTRPAPRASPPTRSSFCAYVVAGVFYGAAGVFITAQTGSADPLIGQPMLLQIFTAVVLGGTLLGGGRGGCLGSVVGAYILMIVVNILLVLNVSAYYSSVAEGAILILAVLAASLEPALARSPTICASAGSSCARAATARRLRHTRPPPSPSGCSGRTSPRRPSPGSSATASCCATSCRPMSASSSSWSRPTLVYGHTLTNPGYFNSLIVLASFLAILALGQGAAILTGGLDLSLPWMIGLSGILLAGLVRGSDAAALWAIPLGLALGTGLGALNGVGIVLLGLPPIVMTLAMNGILQGAALVYSNGTPAGFASPGMRWFMTGKLLGVTPVVWFVVAFVAAALVLLGRTPFGRRVYAVGNSPLVARLAASASAAR